MLLAYVWIFVNKSLMFFIHFIHGKYVCACERRMKVSGRCYKIISYLLSKSHKNITKKEIEVLNNIGIILCNGSHGGLQIQRFMLVFD